MMMDEVILEHIYLSSGVRTYTSSSFGTVNYTTGEVVSAQANIITFQM